MYEGDKHIILLTPYPNASKGSCGTIYYMINEGSNRHSFKIHCILQYNAFIKLKFDLWRMSVTRKK